MDKSAYLDAMGIVRWRQVGQAEPLSAELTLALNAMFAHPLFASVSCRLDEHGLRLTPPTHPELSLPIDSLQTAKDKRAFWQALCRAGVL